jgi:hypothetical protein
MGQLLPTPLETISMRLTSFRAFGASLLLVAAACASPDLLPTSLGGSSADAVGDTNANFTLTPGVVNVCAFFGNDLGPGATLSASAPAGENVLAGNFTIVPNPNCIEVWNASSGATVPVSASLVSATAGWEIDRVVVAVGDGVGDTNFENLFGVTSGTVNVSSAAGGFIWFKFKPVEITIGGQGCTPGYWRQSQHYDSWTAPYTPTTPFSNVFANAFPGKTLGQVVALGGGGLNALGRSAVAALLNGASAGVNYDYTPAQVIALFNTAFASGNKKAIEAQKDVFDFLNNQGCTLN